jgi:hypothetical protein
MAKHEDNRSERIALAMTALHNDEAADLFEELTYEYPDADVSWGEGWAVLDCGKFEVKIEV